MGRSPRQRKLDRTTGMWIFGIGALVLILSRAARIVLPGVWGGPNIGGGFLEIGAILVALAGLVLMVTSAGRSRRH